MVKLKQKKRGQGSEGKRIKRKAGATKLKTGTEPALAPPKRNIAALIVGIVGWLAAIMAGVSILLVQQGAKTRILRHEKKFLEAKNEIKSQVRVDEVGFARRQKQLLGNIDDVRRKQKSLDNQIKPLQSDTRTLEEKEVEKETKSNNLIENFEGARRDIMVAEDDLQAAKARVIAHELNRQELQLKYKKRYDKLYRMLIAQLKKEDVEGTMRFYKSFHHTPFGAAAAYYAAEEYYALRKIDDARKMYAVVVKEYAASSYALETYKRIRQLKEGEPFKRSSARLGIIPYKPPVFIQPMLDK